VAGPGEPTSEDVAAAAEPGSGAARALGEPAFLAAGTEYDEALRGSPEVDGACSRHAFVVAAFLGLQPGRRARAYEVGRAGYLAFAEREASLFGDLRPRLLWEPLEAMWGLACPVVGPDPLVLAGALAERLHEDAPTATLLACGLRAPSLRLTALAAALSPTHKLIAGSPTLRQVASLEGGVDGFLSRRSPRFRTNLRRALKQAKAIGLRHERHLPSTVQEAEALYARAVAIDDRSWKGRAEAGLRGSGLYAFYAEMLPRLALSGDLRMHFLVEGEADVAYLFGARLGDGFRGLQFAFVAGHEAASLGNLAQYHAIEALIDEGVTRYDLGTAVDYKRHWGELLDETVSLIATPRSR